jgi:hypothetical protein
VKIGLRLASASLALASAFLLWNAPYANRVLASGPSPNGAAGEMPAFHDGEEVTINIYQLSANASAQILAKNQNLNMIFASNDLDQPQEFIPVIDAIQGQGFNPLWHQFFIKFNAGFTPHQFTSAQDVEDAASGTNPEITLVDTGEVYRCSIVGNK